MANYNFSEVESKWQKYWNENGVFLTEENSDKEKYYVLDMFPYPSGAGLHVGHPLGYIATDIVSRYKRLKGFNVFHPMGFDSFGLPAEQYAIKTGQHPAVTTEKNIKRFKEQLSILGFSYDWDKEIRTSDKTYYKWTQWIFLKLYSSYYDTKAGKARPIEELSIPSDLNESEKQHYIDQHRLAYQDEVTVNWCPELGTVLANEEVIGGVSERGGYPVVRKPMRQWMMRITAYADRLLDDLEGLDWPESIKQSQKNWIGKSHGAEIDFIEEVSGAPIKVFTTRPDTIYGVTYMVLAPEHELVSGITTQGQQEAVAAYVEEAARKSDLERAELDKSKTGVFTGAYALNPISKERIPIWISDYVLVSYGTGAIMAVPGGDQRDFEFAQKFDIPIIQVISPDGKEISPFDEAYPGKGIMLNSGEYDGMDSIEFTQLITDRLESEGSGKATVNYKLRDWVFTRQRYWGEPIPIIFDEDNQAHPVPESELPVVLPEVDSYKGTKDGQSPLAKVEDWKATTVPGTGSTGERETNTMPQWAGSCWYYMRFLDPRNTSEFSDRNKTDYWLPVDLYVGGAEHAVLHLLYARFWHKALFDLGYVSSKEPFKKLINQGMIQGRSNFVYRVKGTNQYVSYNLKTDFDVDPIHVDISIVRDDILDLDAFRTYHPENSDAEFILEDGKYVCGTEVEKMSKSLLNVVNPDELVAKYGADTFRMYEMFLGPVEQNKPWNTNGIDGVAKFLRKFWRLFFDDDGQLIVSNQEANKQELQVMHRTVKKVGEDIERFSFNTAVSAFMICANELNSLNCHKRSVLQPLVIAIAPFAPHMAEELWSTLGHSDSITFADFPSYDAKYIVDDTVTYPIMVNGKLRHKMEFGLDTSKEDIERDVLAAEQVQKWTEGKAPKKVIVVPKKIVNIVI